MARRELCHFLRELRKTLDFCGKAWYNGRTRRVSKMSEVCGLAKVCIDGCRGGEVRTGFADAAVRERILRVEFECEGLGLRGEFERVASNVWRFQVPNELCRKNFKGEYCVRVWVGVDNGRIMIIKGESELSVRGRKQPLRQ